MVAVLGQDDLIGAEEGVDRGVRAGELLKCADRNDIRPVELAITTGFALDRRLDRQVRLDDPARQHSVADGPSARSAKILGNDRDP